MSDNAIFLGSSGKPEDLYLAMANRHGLVTGATGTGKTVTLQIMAEAFCKAGVPVFAADVKGDLSGISQAGEPRISCSNAPSRSSFEDYGFEATPTIFWDLFGDRAIRFAPPSPKWGRCCSRASWVFRMRRKVPSISASRLPTRKAWPSSI